MNEKMIKTAYKIFKYAYNYYRQLRKEQGDPNGGFYIRHENGHIVMFADNEDLLLEMATALKGKVMCEKNESN